MGSDGETALEASLGIVFRDRALLARSLTHRSYANETGEPDNEVLEFLGDALLGFLVAEMALHHGELRDEGSMTRVKSQVVCEETLADVARELQLGPHLRISRGEDKTGGRDKASILADALEALLAAVYLDQGIDAARRVVAQLLRRRVEVGQPEDPKSRLQERCHVRGEPLPRYRIVDSTGPDHRPEFVVECSLSGGITTQGAGSSKKDAEREAARRALVELDARE